MNRRAAYVGAAMAVSLTAITAATARPVYLNTFKAHYKTAAGKPTLNGANCAMCHIGAPPQKNFNAFGMAFIKALGGQNNDAAKIAAAFDAAAKVKNPATGETFGDRIAKDALPAGTTPVGGGSGGGGGSVYGTWTAAYNGINMDGLSKTGDWSIKNGSLVGSNGSVVTGKDYKNFSLVVVARGAGSIQLPSGEVALGGGTAWTSYQISVQNGHRTMAVNGQSSGGEVAGAANAGKVGVKAAGSVEVAQIWIMELP